MRTLKLEALRVLVFAVAVVLPANLVAQVLVTSAGGFVGDGGPATAASFTLPEGLAMDSAGNLYVGGFSQARVRKISPSGVISTVAGTGISGFSGDGGPATAAMLSYPTGVAVDAAGNLLIAVQGNSRVRKVDTSGKITTIAGNGTFGFSGDGGPATQASLHGPWGLTVDSVGNIYFSDIGNQRVRKLDTSGIITTVAGNGTAGFNGDNIPATTASLNSPRGLVVDAAGDLYIADSVNKRVRKVDTSGMITTVAGNGSGGNSGDGGPATAASVNPRYLILDSSGNLIIASGARLRKVDLTSGIITSIAGSGFGFNGDGQPALNTLFGTLSGLSFDSAGNLLMADSDNSRVRKISPSQIVTTVAGGYIGDGAPASFASLNQPEGAVSDGAGNIYIADAANNRVRKVTPSGTITTVAGTGFSGHTGDGGPASAATLFSPQTVAVDPAGNLFIADNGNGVIRKVDTSGVITTFLVPAIESSSFISAMTTDASGNLYFADQVNCVIQEATPSAVVTKVAGTFECGFTGDGNATSQSLNAPSGVALDSVGNIYIGDTGNNRVRKVDSEGNLTTIAGNGTCSFSGDTGPASLATLCGPEGVAVSGGNILIADTSNFRVRKIDNSGNINTIAGSGSQDGFNGDGLSATLANLSDPVGVLFDPAGNLYIVDDSQYRLRELLASAPPAQSATLTFSPSPTPETQIATVGETTTDPAAQSMAITLNSVINPITVNLQFHYQDTELSAGHGGVGIADGICERSLGATEQTDFDCRLADGGFVFQTLPNGDQVVPHIIPSHNNFGVWVRAVGTRVSDGQPAVPGVDYTGPVDWYYAWNANPPLFPSPNPEYSFGWNNLNPQMFDRHGDDPDIAFKFNITTYAKFNCTPTCVGTNDPGLGGRTPTLNDVVAADPPNPPTGSVDAEETVVPVPGVSPYPYFKRLPMLVAFELEKQGTEITDPTALTLPHSVNVAVLDPVTGLRQNVVTPPRFPTTFTYNPFLKLYYIFLSPQPYTVGKVYQLQINSDLFPKPVNAKFVVRSF